MKIQKTKLAKAISLAVAGTALSIGAVSTASAHVSYNTYNAGGLTNTDGHVFGFNTDPQGAANATPGFVGEPDSNGDGNGDTPFGYNGGTWVNWGARLHHAGASLEVSEADALADYGVAVEVDTASGAWLDNTGVNGWRHQTDIGLFKSMVTQTVHLTPSADNGAFSQFGISVYHGMDTSTSNINHHGPWNNGDPTIDNPFGTTGLTYVDHATGLSGGGSLSFTAQAGEIYSIYLGGYMDGGWNSNIDSYTLDITSSPVPVPAAVWLFGTALAGLGVTGRRKKTEA